MRYDKRILAVKKYLDNLARLHGIARKTSDIPKRGFKYHKKKKIYFERDTPPRKRILEMIKKDNVRK